MLITGFGTTNLMEIIFFIKLGGKRFDGVPQLALGKRPDAFQIGHLSIKDSSEEF